MASLFDRLKDMVGQKKQHEEQGQSDADLYAKIVKAGKEGNSLDGLKEDFLKAVHTHKEARDNAIYKLPYEAVKNAMGEQCQPVEKQQQKIVAASIKISTEKIGHLLDERRALSNKTRDLMSIGG